MSTTGEAGFSLRSMVGPRSIIYSGIYTHENRLALRIGSENKTARNPIRRLAAQSKGQAFKPMECPGKPCFDDHVGETLHNLYRLAA
jgi:hypothetical protein